MKGSLLVTMLKMPWKSFCICLFVCFVCLFLFGFFINLFTFDLTFVLLFCWNALFICKLVILCIISISLFLCRCTTNGWMAKMNMKGKKGKFAFVSTTVHVCKLIKGKSIWVSSLQFLSSTYRKKGNNFQFSLSLPAFLNRKKQKNSHLIFTDVFLFLFYLYIGLTPKKWEYASKRFGICSPKLWYAEKNLFYSIRDVWLFMKNRT